MTEDYSPGWFMRKWREPLSAHTARPTNPEPMTSSNAERTTPVTQPSKSDTSNESSTIIFTENFLKLLISQLRLSLESMTALLDLIGSTAPLSTETKSAIAREVTAALYDTLKKIHDDNHIMWGRPAYCYVCGAILDRVRIKLAKDSNVITMHENCSHRFYRDDLDH
jgi:hypothetical protein